MDNLKEAYRQFIAPNKKSFWLGFLIGLIYFSYIFWWVWSIYPLDAFGVSSKYISIAILIFAFLLAISTMSVFWGILGIVISQTKKSSLSIKFQPALIASAYVLLEYLRAMFFSIFWYGSGGSIGPYWPFGNIAYWLADLRILSISASMWGIYGINFIIIFLATALFLFFSEKPSKKNLFIQFIAVISLPIFIYLFSNSLDNSKDLPPIPVALIQTNIPSAGFDTADENLNDLKQKLTLLEKAAETSEGGIVVFPEGTNFLKSLGQFLGPDDVKKYFKNLSEKEFLVIDSVRILDEEENFKSRAIYINTKAGAIGFYDKQILTPMGEYLAYIIKWPLILLNTQLLEDFKTYREYTPGFGTNIFKYNGLSIQTLICSELISPQKAKSSNSDLIIIAGSFSIWRDNPLPRAQAIAMARFRAIENGKSVLFASNSARSYLINKRGVIEKKTDSSGYELLTGTIVPNENQTWYNYIGDWPILLLSSVIFGLGIRKFNNDSKA